MDSNHSYLGILEFNRAVAQALMRDIEPVTCFYRVCGAVPNFVSSAGMNHPSYLL
jgi:hypothetical protein